MADDHSGLIPFEKVKSVRFAICDVCRQNFILERPIRWGTPNGFTGVQSVRFCSGLCALRRLFWSENDRIASPFNRRNYNYTRLVPYTWGWVERSHNFPQLHKLERFEQ